MNKLLRVGEFGFTIEDANKGGHKFVCFLISQANKGLFWLFSQSLIVWLENVWDQSGKLV